MGVDVAAAGQRLTDEGVCFAVGAGVPGVLVTVLSQAPIGRVLRPCSGGTRFAGALDSAIDRRSADGEQFG